MAAGRWCVTCPKCGRSFTVHSGFSDMTVQCRKCGRKIFLDSGKDAQSLVIGILIGIFGISFFIGFPFGISIVIALVITGIIVFKVINPWKEKQRKEMEDEGS